MCFPIAWSAQLSCSLEPILVLTLQHSCLYTADLQWILLLHACPLLLQNTFSPISILPDQTVLLFQLKFHAYNPSHIFPSLHPVPKPSTHLFLTSLYKFQQFISVKTVHTFPPEKAIWASHPLPDCFAVFVRILCYLLLWFKWMLPSHDPSLIISICLSAILFCLQFIYVFPSFLPFSYDAPAFLFTVVMLQSFLIQISYAPLASMCLYVFSFVFLFFIYV